MIFNDIFIRRFPDVTNRFNYFIFLSSQIHLEDNNTCSYFIFSSILMRKFEEIA